MADKTLNYKDIMNQYSTQIQKVELENYNIKDISINWDEYFGQPGKEHYKLLSWLASQYSGHDIFDIGTHRGASALALASGCERNTIYSFDLDHKYNLPQRPNIQYFLDDLLTPAGRLRWEKKILSSAFIFLDIDPHEGTREYEFYKWLKSKNYAGFLVCDDIWYFKEMRDNFWYKIPGTEKIDITNLGHWSGTGIVRFSPSQLWPEELSEKPNNWTVVTAYFDLTKMPDASNSIKERTAEHYLKNAISTLSINQNLVIFCEPEHIETICRMRPSWLLENHTRIITFPFENFPLCKFRDAIENNRLKKPSVFYDDRNTVSYYLLCMARYAMMKHVIQENPFQSTHFSWLNICIERMGWSNTKALEAVWRENREKFSTCFIDYQPESFVTNFEEYFKWGVCSMCSGFFTGTAEYMTAFCNAIEQKFIKVCEAGYGGHADEQLYPLVYFDNPDLFDNYYGDYQQMIVNYVEPVERSFEPVRLLIQHSFDHGNLAVAEKASKCVWESWKRGHISFSEQELNYFIQLYRTIQQKLGRGNLLP
jgi:hypothetical protein